MLHLGPEPWAVYFPVKNAILMNPVTPMERVLVARLGIVVGHFCKGAKICLRTEAGLLPHNGNHWWCNIRAGILTAIWRVLWK